MVEGGENLSRNDEFLMTVHQWVDMPRHHAGSISVFSKIWQKQQAHRAGVSRM